MKDPSYRNILVAVSGLTPQIVTETLYGLMIQKKIPVQEIYVITTSIGKKILENTLLQPMGPFSQFCAQYGLLMGQINIEPILIKNQRGDALEDIRTREDNEDMAKTIMQKVYQLTAVGDTRVFASIAGGRKTMSAYMALAMQLFGREQDRLSHVLIRPPELESDKEFYFPPRSKKVIKTSRGDTVPVKDIRIDLAEIPFIRLRNTIQEELGVRVENYLDLVELSQFKIDEVKNRVQSRWEGSEKLLIVEFGEKRYQVQLSPKFAAIYHYACLHPAGFEVTKATEDAVAKELSELYNTRYKAKEFDRSSYGKTWEFSQIQKDISGTNKMLRKSLPAPLFKLLRIELKRSPVSPLYKITFPPRIAS